MLLLHPDAQKPVSAIGLMKGQMTTATALHIAEGAELKDHTTPVPALLLCVLGHARYTEAATSQHTDLLPGHYVHIAPGLVHRVEGLQDSHLVLIR